MVVNHGKANSDKSGSHKLMKSTSATANAMSATQQLGVISLEAAFYLLGGLLPLSALLLFWRRMAGALSPAPAVVLFGIAIAWVLARLAIEVLLQLRGTTETRLRERLIFSASLLGVAGSLSLPHSSPLGLMLLWGLLLTSEASFWRVSLVPSRLLEKALRPKPKTKPITSAASATAPPVEDPLDRIEPLETTPGDQVIQQMTRVVHEGVETIAGRHWVAFKPGGRTESVHLSFCPPFAKTPRFDVESIEGPPVKIKQVRLLPQGVRLDLKLEHETSEPVAVGLEFSAWLESH